MSSMRTIAAALEARAEETKRYNAAGAGISIPANALYKSEGYDLPYEVTIEQLGPLIVPKYAPALPATDGWGNRWLIAIDKPWQGTEPAQNYAIVSPGRHGRFDPKVSLETCASWDCDIVFSNGTWVSRFPGYSREDQR